MSTRKERKSAILTEVAADKEKAKARKAELSAMEPELRKTEKAADKAAKKAAKKARKLEIKQMQNPEKRENKKHDKVYKKIWNRPRRLVKWIAAVCIVALIVAIAAPIVGDLSSLFAISLDSETPQGIEARENGEAVAEAISDEGIVLLKNEGSTLPIADGKLNVFSVAADNIRYGGGGSGGADQSRSATLYEGLTVAGIEYNSELYDLYGTVGGRQKEGRSTGLIQTISSMLDGSAEDEPDVSYLTDDVLAQAKAYSQNALIVLASDSVEASDAEPGQLGLAGNKRALVEKVAANFDNVIIVINAGNAMELGFLDEYPSIKAALWIGTPGPKGCVSLGKILAGEVNPSGRLVDTYAYDVSSNPASENFGNYGYTNISMAYLDYEEGIYVGYRFYETYYDGNEAAYQAAVQFPFGYGLSYTDFEWEIVDRAFDGSSSITIGVEVTNTGNAAGKDVVQLYFSAPYTPGGIEKSVIELGGYAKTKLLQPGESEIVKIELPVRDMSSYDMSRGVYVLEAGEYTIHISRNVHDAAEQIKYSFDDEIVYDTDEATGTAIQNLFDYADSGLTYLSRSDWSGTWPAAPEAKTAASQELVTAHKDFTNPKAAVGELPTMGADNGLVLANLKGLDYNDPLWEQYLDQFTMDEMSELVLNGAYHTVAIDRLGVPSSVLLDGPAGINSFFSSVTAASYPTEVVIASTWNDELAYRMGEAVGIEANAYGVSGWYAPGMNIHRTPQGGRNFEYFSEDPLLSGKMSAAMVSGAQSRDIIVTMKHYAMNEQEVNARSGVFIWANEQAIREIYLRPFEITVKEGEVTGVMSSFVHIGYKWAGANEELLKDILRGEWGFRGLVTTDARLLGFMDVGLGLRYGNDLMLDPIPSRVNMDKLYKADPVGIAQGLRYCTKNICYSLVNYTTLVG